MAKKRLKDKVWHYQTIIIHKLVEQYKDNISIENKSVCFFVTVKDNCGRTMFRVESVAKLLKSIKERICL